VVQAVQSCGIAPEPLLAEAGIEKELLSDPDARLRVEDMSRLWKLAVEMTGDSCIGLRAAAHIRPTSFHALGFALMVSSSMADALERMERFHRIVSDAVDVWFESGSETTAVCLDASDRKVRPCAEAFDMIMAAVIRFARVLTSDTFNPVRIEFMRERPQGAEAFEQFFRAPLRFSAALNRIFFLKEGLEAPLPGANAEIARGNDQIIIDYLARFDRRRTAHQARARLIELLPRGEPSIEALARSMGMSTRGLHRHLRKDKTSYRAILDETRRYLAAQYLKQPHLPIIEIAFRLGYSDSSNFTRAFRRWYGVSPREFRKSAP
jgi:AraC-like DNA-binding protein